MHLYNFLSQLNKFSRFLKSDETWLYGIPITIYNLLFYFHHLQKNKGEWNPNWNIIINGHFQAFISISTPHKNVTGHKQGFSKNLNMNTTVF